MEPVTVWVKADVGFRTQMADATDAGVEVTGPDVRMETCTDACTSTYTGTYTCTGTAAARHAGTGGHWHVHKDTK